MSLLGVTQVRTTTPRQAGALLQTVTVEDGVLTLNRTVADLSRLITPTSSSPNALAYDASAAVAYVSSLSGSNSKLFRVVMATGVVTSIGDLFELAGGATFFNGSYWYAVARADRLRRVTFKPNGNVLSDSIEASFTGGREAFDYGDIDFITPNTLVVSASQTVGSTTNRVFFTYNLATGQLVNLSTSAILSQITVSNGVVYNHHTGSGNWSVLGLDGRLGPTLFVTPGYTDVSAVPCFTSSPVTPPTTSTTTQTTTTGTATGTSTSTSTTTMTTTTTEPLLPSCSDTTAAPVLVGVSANTGNVDLISIPSAGALRVTRLGSVAPLVTATSSSPNALAFDFQTGSIYLASFTGTFSRLFKMDIATRGVSSLGDLSDLAGGATFYNRSYWYVTQRSDRLRRVELDSRGLVVRDVLVASMARTLRLFDYGDIAFANRYTLLLSATEMSAAGVALAKRFMLFDLETLTLRMLSGPLVTQSALSQISLGRNGEVFNHNTTTAVWTRLSLTGDVVETLGTSAAYSDVATVLCTDVDLDLFPTTTTTTSTTTTTTATSTSTTTGTSGTGSTAAATSPASTTPQASTSTSTQLPPYLACPSTSPAIFGVTLANSFQTGGNVIAFHLGSNGWETTLVGNVASWVSPTLTSPNALAYDPATSDLYFASFSGKYSRLFKFNMITRLTVSLGDLAELAGGATFLNGAYWYTAQRADRLRRVALHPTTGRVFNDTIIANMTGGTRLWDYGDVDFLANGTLAIGATRVQSNGVAIAREFALFTPGPNTLQIVRSDPAGVYSQIAVALGTVYNHQSSTGMWTALNSTGHPSELLFSSLSLTDIAAHRCP